MHRAARISTIALLVIGVLAIAILFAWSLHARAQFEEVHASVKGGLTAVAVLAGTKYLVILAALIAAGIALTIAWLRARPWAYPTTSILGGVLIAAVWFARAVIVRMEDPRFRARSPWVHAATLVAIVATIYLVLVTATAIVTWRSRPRAA